MADENEIQMLLRLKRYEQPPPEYWDSFVSEFRRRQRAEMLRQPLWRIAVDRVGAFFSEHSMPRHAYAVATLAVVAAGAIAAVGIISPAGPSSQLAAAGPKGGTVRPVDTRSAVALGERGRLPTLIDEPARPRMRTAVNGGTRYVIDARPVSYEPAFNF